MYVPTVPLIFAFFVSTLGLTNFFHLAGPEDVRCVRPLFLTSVKPFLHLRKILFNILPADIIDFTIFFV